MVELKRYCQLNDLEEIEDLKQGMDFRLPQHRREVFKRLYQFNLKYNAHAGFVYGAFPYINEKFKLMPEQKLWLGFLNGCSQNIVTSWILFQEFPELKNLDTNQFDKWWNKNYNKFIVGKGWDLDRRYFKIGKTGLINCIKSYKEQVDKYGNQQEMFNAICSSNDKYINFEKLWEFIRNNFLSFGRLSTFSYTEFLRLQGVNVDCNELFLDDISGSRSHRNGLCKVLGRDDLDWWKTKITYDKETIKWLNNEADILFEEMKEKTNHHDLSFYTFETALCNYKSMHRPDRRYPNVYNDMFYNRVKYAESMWVNNYDFDLFWEMRKNLLPKELRLEENPKDFGLHPYKQNFYLNTGQVIMMDKEWSCFKNDYNDYVGS
jgi:hypothetical protein